MPLWLWIVLGVFFLFLAPSMVMSSVLYIVLLVRKSPEKWRREPSLPEDEEYVRLFNDGKAWFDRYADCRKAVHVHSEGLKLAGEYFDFGADRAVLLLPGRMESCVYSCHYAEGWRQAGWNVLVVDNRAHGESEGRINCVGQREWRDVLAWAHLLHDELGNAKVALHGICSGSSAMVFAVTEAACPDWIAGVAVDGIFKSFYSSTRNHMVHQKRPIFPFLYGIMAWVMICSRVDPVWNGPYRRLPKLTKPILFLHSREDVYSPPADTQRMYDSCPSEKKRIVWFDKGDHSRVRINNPEQYDQAVMAFAESIAGDA